MNTKYKNTVSLIKKYSRTMNNKELKQFILDSPYDVPSGLVSSLIKIHS